MRGWQSIWTWAIVSCPAEVAPAGDNSTYNCSSDSADMGRAITATFQSACHFIHVNSVRFPALIHLCSSPLLCASEGLFVFILSVGLICLDSKQNDLLVSWRFDWTAQKLLLSDGVIVTITFIIEWRCCPDKSVLLCWNWYDFVFRLAGFSLAALQENLYWKSFFKYEKSADLFLWMYFKFLLSLLSCVLKKYLKGITTNEKSVIIYSTSCETRKEMLGRVFTLLFSKQLKWMRWMLSSTKKYKKAL